ncbi:amidohydrolase family protein [Pseudonocardia nigra]|uniref:amidohydrolase family protein n=1 Tax=Pseudonocardia nigra TaxID=1921578 RepID=UPI001C5E528E|nr:amidohydrolase family protein [Pseudonocardia nigra]
MSSARARPSLVDCDIHNELAPDSLTRYLPARWRHYDETYGSRGDGGFAYPKGAPRAARTDAWPPSGLPPGADLDFMRTQLLDPFDIRYGILNCLAKSNRPNPDYAAALCRAVNDWQIDEWLEKEPRLRAGITVPYEYPSLAAEEIDRSAGHPGFVQVLLLVRTDEPLGRRKYWPVFEAAVRHGLPIGIHFGGAGRNPLTASGWPSFYIEDHTLMAQAFQAQVVSLVVEGVFERFPGLRVVLIEGGFGWLPSLMWRLDAHWARLRDEVPHLTRRPSEYIREHFWVTTQPVEEPPDPKDLLTVFDHMGGTDRIMFSTDYPHWDFDHPDRAIRVRLDAETRERIMSGNATALYGLD